MSRYDPFTGHPAYNQAKNSRAPRESTPGGGDVYAAGRRRRLIVSVIGIVGFLLLLLGAHFAGGLQKPLQAAALVWFLAFGVVRFAMDLTQL